MPDAWYVNCITRVYIWCTSARAMCLNEPLKRQTSEASAAGYRGGSN
jgi:hypothetical protein